MKEQETKPEVKIKEVVYEELKAVKSDGDLFKYLAGFTFFKATSKDADTLFSRRLNECHLSYARDHKQKVYAL